MFNIAKIPTNYLIIDFNKLEPSFSREVSPSSDTEMKKHNAPYLCQTVLVFSSEREKKGRKK